METKGCLGKGETDTTYYDCCTEPPIMENLLHCFLLEQEFTLDHVLRTWKEEDLYYIYIYIFYTVHFVLYLSDSPDIPSVVHLPAFPECSSRDDHILFPEKTNTNRWVFILEYINRVSVQNVSVCSKKDIILSTYPHPYYGTARIKKTTLECILSKLNKWNDQGNFTPAPMLPTHQTPTRLTSHHP